MLKTSHKLFSFLAPLACQLLLNLSGYSQSVVVPPTHSPLGYLGQGYDFKAQKFRSSCLQGSPQYAGEAATTIAMEKAMTEDQLNAVSHGSMSGKIDLFIASAEVSASYYRSLEQRSKSLTISWGRNVKGQSVVLAEPTIAAAGARVKDSADRDLKHLTCGDGFLSQIDLGAAVILTATIHFANERFRDEFHAKAKYRVWGIRRVKEISHGSEWSRGFSKIEFDGYQVGGDPGQLERLLGSLDKVTCTIDTMKDCHPAIDALHAYAFGADGLTKQLHNLEYSQGQPFAPIAYHFDRYDARGFEGLEADKLPDLAGQREVFAKIAPQLARFDRLKADADYLLATRWLMDQERAGLVNLSRDLVFNRRQLTKLRTSCISAPGQCRKKYLEIEQRAISLEPLSVPDRIEDYCRWADVSSEGSKLAILMAALSQSAGVACYELGDVAQQMTTLNLASLGIDTLAPVAFFPNLKALDASYNNIPSARPLIGLKKLETLNLRNNQLTSAHALEQLPELSRLNGAYNRITDLSMFADSKVTVLKAHGNPLKNTEYLEKHRRRFQVLTLRNFDICEWERQKLLATGYDPESIALKAKYGFAPWYNEPHNPHSGIEGWYKCDIVAKDYL